MLSVLLASGLEKEKLQEMCPQGFSQQPADSLSKPGGLFVQKSLVNARAECTQRSERSAHVHPITRHSAITQTWWNEPTICLGAGDRKLCNN